MKNLMDKFQTIFSAFMTLMYRFLGIFGVVDPNDTTGQDIIDAVSDFSDTMGQL